MPELPHIVLAIAAAALAGRGVGRDRRAAEGDRRRQRGDLDDHAQLHRDLGRRRTCSARAARCRKRSAQQSVPVSNDVGRQRASCPSSGAIPSCRACTSGCSSRSRRCSSSGSSSTARRRGYEVRAVGLNPEAARYGGINVGRNYVRVMAVCGLFAGLAGALDILGWQFRVATNDIQISQVGFFGIAVALLGRNTASGTAVAALLFGALLSGTLAAQPRPGDLRARAGDEPHVHHPGPRRAHRERRRARAGLLRRGRRLIRRGRRGRRGGGGRGVSTAVATARRRGRSGRARGLGRDRAGRARRVHRAAAGAAAHAGAVARPRAPPPWPPAAGRSAAAASAAWAGARSWPASWAARAPWPPTRTGERNLEDVFTWSALDRRDAALRDAADASPRSAASSPSAAAS